MRHSYLLTILLALSGLTRASAQSDGYHYLTSPKDTCIRHIQFYAGFVHQHQDYFSKPFSLQGAEVGVSINHHFQAGCYYSAFASTLHTATAGAASFVSVRQMGLFVGSAYDTRKVLHTGYMINVGYFSILHSADAFPAFNSGSSPRRLAGLVIAPQLYGALNTTAWLRLRAGITYSFYSFEDQSAINRADLQNIAVCFAFLFGKFR